MTPFGSAPSSRSFLFLQGPHGPFFYELSKHLRQAGARVAKIGFNEGDRFFWRDRATFVPFTAPHSHWRAYIRQYIAENVTDLVIYNDTRPLHAAAIEAARDMGVRIHCFEEGYIRP